MSACGCIERGVPIKRRAWRIVADVLRRLPKHGPMPRLKARPGAYVRCLRCRARWKTRARYVTALRWDRRSA